MKQTIWKYEDIDQCLSQKGQRELVLVGGCFDILHFGHITFLKHAKHSNAFLMIVLESDRYITTHKHRIPTHNQLQRAQILAELRMVDAVILLPYFAHNNDYTEMVQHIRPDVIAVTAGDNQLANKKLQAQKVHATIKIATGLLPDFSSTKISQIT